MLFITTHHAYANEVTFSQHTLHAMYI